MGSIIIIKAVLLHLILIVMSVIDLKYRIIPNKLVLVTLFLGVILLFAGDISAVSGIFGAIIGGGIMFLLALVPNALGGGDIKIVFALGLFLGINKILWAIFLAFSLSSVAALFLILFKIKGRKDYIPFGPFIALGSCISFLFI